jgi:hypothetical protein
VEKNRRFGKSAEKLIHSKKTINIIYKIAFNNKKVIENLRKLPELEGEGTIEKNYHL